jgi:acetyl esterase/lipase
MNFSHLSFPMLWPVRLPRVVLAATLACAGIVGTAARATVEAGEAVEIGGRTLRLLTPRSALPSRPWVLAPRLYSPEEPGELRAARVQAELVKKGFHVVALPFDQPLTSGEHGRAWSDTYRSVRVSLSLSDQVVLMAVGEEGPGVIRWASDNPGRVSCLYLDKARTDLLDWKGTRMSAGQLQPEWWERVSKANGFTSPDQVWANQPAPADTASRLADARVALLYVADRTDPTLSFRANAGVIEEALKRRGGFFRAIALEKEDAPPFDQAVKDSVRFVEMNTPGVSPSLRAVAYGPHFNQVLEVWKAPTPGPNPYVIYIHGGGWTQGTRLNVPNLEEYLQAGISVVSVGYRFIAQAQAEKITPPVRGPMHDAVRAVQYVRSKAREWNLDAERVAFAGASAGSCTALWIAFHPDFAQPASPDPVARQSTRPFCVAVAQPQTTLDPRQMKDWIPNSKYGAHAFGLGSFEEFHAQRESLLPWINEFSPYGLTSASAPPVYLHYSEAPKLGEPQRDPTHSANFGVKLQERLNDLHVPCVLVYPGAPNISHERPVDYIKAMLRGAAAAPASMSADL